MPKLKKSSVPSYRHHKQSGRAIVTLSGRDHLLGKHGSNESRQAYDRLIAQWLPNNRRGAYRPAEGITVSRVIVEFWAHARTYYVTPAGELSKEADNFRVALIPLRRLDGSTNATAFGPLALKASDANNPTSTASPTRRNASKRRTTHRHEASQSNEICEYLGKAPWPTPAASAGSAPTADLGLRPRRGTPVFTSRMR